MTPVPIVITDRESFERCRILVAGALDIAHSVLADEWEKLQQTKVGDRLRLRVYLRDKDGALVGVPGRGPGEAWVPVAELDVVVVDAEAKS